MAVRTHTHTGHDALLVTDTHIHTVLLALGRVIFGAYFIYAGLHHFMDHATLAGFAAQRGVPWPNLAVLGTGVLMLVGGLAIATGTAPRFGAACIALFLIGVTPIMHAFWSDPTAPERAADIGNFAKNIALLGATGIVAAVPNAWHAVAESRVESVRPM